jgi:NDP-sugar pyrophosphorylase family protein
VVRNHPDQVIGYCLAAGRGSRLAPLTLSVPKPLLRPAGRPLLDLAVEALHRAGAGWVVVNAHHGAGLLAAHLAGRPGVRLTREPVLLGTGGALAAARRAGLLAGRILVTCADRVVDPADLAELAAFLDRSGAPMAAGLVPAGPGATRLRLDGDRLHPDPAGPWDAAGVYALRAEVLDRLDPVPSSLLGALLEPLMAAGALAGRPLARASADAGTLAGLLDVSAGLLAGRWPYRLPPGRLLDAAEPVFLAEGATSDPAAVLAGPVMVDAGATVAAGALLSRAIVGPAAVVGRGAQLVGGVLGPGARLAPGERATAALLPGPAGSL